MNYQRQTSIKGDAVEATAEHLKKLAKDYYPNKAGGTGDSSNARFGYVNDYIHTYSYPCHRDLNKTTKGSAAVYSLYCKPVFTQLPEDVHRDHFAWLVGDHSPWRSLLNMEPRREFCEPDFWWSNGFIFSDLAKMPANLIMNFFVATRMPKEWPEQIKNWHRLVKQFDVDPALAYTALKLWNDDIGSSNSNECRFTFNTSNFYDWPLDNGTCGEDYVRNFCYANPVNAKGSLGERYDPNSEEPYGKINVVWGTANASINSTGKPSYQRFLFDLYSEKMGSRGGKQRRFGGGDSTDVTPTSWTLTFTQVIDLLHEEEKRLAKPKRRRKAA